MARQATTRSRGAGDLLPLPSELSPADGRRQTKDGRLPMPRDNATWRTGVAAWVFLAVLLVNILNCGCASVTVETMTHAGPVSAGQRASLNRIEEAVRQMLRDPDRILETTDWTAVVKGRKMSYTGELAAKAESLCWEAIEPALPPRHLAGRVNATALADGVVRDILEDPGQVLLPRNEWPERFKRAQIRVESPQEYERIVGHLVERNVFGLLTRDQLIWHNGQALTNGMFGVSKGTKVWSERHNRMIGVLRLIINLIPSNELQRNVTGDTRTLPYFAQLLGLTLTEEEVLLWSSEDMKCAFYVFGIPEAWWPYMVIDRSVDGAVVGRAAGLELWPCVRVVPMGWILAVMLVQYLHRQLCLLPFPSGGELPPELELRKDRPLPTGGDFVVRSFFQEYIDNFDGGIVLSEEAAAERLGQVQQWQRNIREVWRHWGIADSSDKAIVESFSAPCLGCEVDGRLGWAGLSTLKNLELVDLTMYMLTSPNASRLHWAIGGGKFVFGFQLQRAAMVVLNNVWDCIGGKMAARDWVAHAGDEWLLSLCALPFLHLDLRLGVSGLVTCSDASEEGGGVCRSTGVTGMARENLTMARRAAERLGNDSIGLVESFGGIGAGRRALEILGVVPCFHVSIETCEAAQRVTRAAWPEVIELGDICEVSGSAFTRLELEHPHLRYVLQLGGAPCQDVAAGNVTRLGLDGKRSVLVHELIRLHAVLVKRFRYVQVHTLGENVASMTAADRAKYNEIFQCAPVKLDAKGVLWCRRDRLFWPDWELLPSQGVTISADEEMIYVKMIGVKAPARRWLPRGWRLPSLDVVFHTFTRPKARKSPPICPSGLRSTEPHEVERWKADAHRFPPYQYADRYCLRKGTAVRLLPATSREIMLGFNKDHTYPACTAAVRKGQAKAFEDTRNELIGNSMAVPVVVWLWSNLFFQYGIFGYLPGADDLADNERLWLGSRAVSDAERQAWTYALNSNADELVARMLLTRQTFRGGELRLLTGPCRGQAGPPQHIDPRMWGWQSIISCRWKASPEHINVLECRALGLALRWRARAAKQLGKHFIHLVDSQVVLGATAKGRSSSFRLRHILMRNAAVQLGGFLRPVLGYCRSHTNPADRPSRRASAVVRPHPSQTKCESEQGGRDG